MDLQTPFSWRNSHLKKVQADSAPLIGLSTTSRLCSGSGGLTQTILIKPSITCVLAKKKICLKFQLCLCLLILCGFISNCHLKSIWCEIASIYEAPHIFIQIPSKEKKVSDNSFYCGPHKNEFATDNALLYFIHLDFKKNLSCL